MEGTLSFGPRIFDAESIYILDVSGHPRAADELHQELERWDRFEIVADVLEADLVFAVDVVEEEPVGSNGNGGPTPWGAGSSGGLGLSLPLAEARAVMLVVDPRTRTVLWQDSEAYDLREHRTSEKVVGRFRAHLLAAAQQETVGQEAPGAGTLADTGSVPAGSIPEGTEPPEVMERGAEWTSRLGMRIGYRWHAVVGNAGESELPVEVRARLIDRLGNTLVDQTRCTVVPSGGEATVVAEGDVPERTARRATEWEIVARRRPVPAQAHDFDFGHEELEPPRLAGDTVSRLMLPPGTTASVSCLVREDGTVASAVVRNVGPEGLTTGQVGDIVQVLVSQAVKEWRFEPGRRFGEPATGWVTVELAWSD